MATIPDIPTMLVNKRTVKIDGHHYDLFSGFCRHMVGEIEVYALLDGYTNLGLDTFVGDDPVALRQLLGAAFVADDYIQFGVTAHLLKTPAGTVLIDTGSGTYFGPAAGQFPTSLAMLGIDPASIDQIYITHMHTDHTGGLVNGQGRAFPNAELLINEIDYRFFTDPAELEKSPARTKPAYTLAQSLKGLYPTIMLFEGEVALSEFVRAIPAYGHTPGHTVFLVESFGEQMLVIGDTVFSPDFSFQYLDYTLAYDNDIPLARKKRRKILTTAMDDRLLIAGTHLPFTSFGYVRPFGPTFEFVPLRVVP